MTTPIGRPSIAGGVQLTVKLLQSGQQAAIVFGGKEQDATAYTQQMAQNNLADTWSIFRRLMSNSVACVGGTFRSLDDTEPFVYELSQPANPSGAVASGSSVPASAALVVKWTTEFGGRSGRGRTFFPGLPGQWIQADGRSLVPTASTEVQAAVTEYLDQVAAPNLTYTPAIISFSDAVARPIRGGSLSPVIGTQRRRMR